MMDSGVVESRIFALGDGDVRYTLGLARLMPAEPRREHPVYRDGVEVDEMRPMYGTALAMTLEYLGMASDVIAVQLSEREAVQAREIHDFMLHRLAVRSGASFEVLKVLDSAGDCCQVCFIPNGKYRDDDSMSLTTWNPRQAEHWEREDGRYVTRTALSVGLLDGRPAALCQSCLAASKGEAYPVRRRKAA